MKLENGKPLSLANAHTWRLEDAMQVIVPTMDKRIKIVVKKAVAAIEFVELYKT